MDPREVIGEWDEGIVFMDGYDEALVGVCQRYGMPPVALYDTEKVVAMLVAQGLTEADAMEYFYFNMEGAWVGDHTPAFATFMPKENI